MRTGDELIAAVEEHGSIRAAARALGMPFSTFHKYHKQALEAVEADPIPEFGFTPSDDMMVAPHIGENGVDTIDRTSPGKVKRYIVTSAQNNCRVHQGFWENLKAFAAHIDAEIMVSFSIYDRQNYRGLVRKGEMEIKRQDLWWDKAFEGHTVNQRVRLAKRLAFCGELDILATAANPLSGMDSYCGRSSVIVPHNKFQFRCVESRKGHMPKELYTTGSATEKRFIQRKAGQVAQFHHVIGALLVEVDEDGYFWVHHLNAEEDGSFQWLDQYVTQGAVKKQDWVAGLILGDVHHEKLDESVAGLTLQEIIPTLKPQHVVLHDLIDFSSRNHHNIKDPLFRVKVKDTRVRDEIMAAKKFIEDVSAAVVLSRDSFCEVHIIESNHDEALLRWLKETDWRTDPINAEFYLQLALRAVRKVDDPNFNLLHDTMDSTPFGKFLKVDDTLDIQGIECGMHGHVGPSGARGSPKGFSRLGFKSFTAHTHTPSIVDGCYTVGVMGKLDMGYNRGPSKWMHTHGIIYNNGKRAFVTIKNGKWRA